MSESKADKIAEVQANLPLPDQPPKAGDFNSADATTVNRGSGGVSAPISKADDTGVAGRQGADGLGGLPNDALAGNAKKSADAVDTTNADKGYPQQSDPAGSFDAKVSGRGNPPTA